MLLIVLCLWSSLVAMLIAVSKGAARGRIGLFGKRVPLVVHGLLGLVPLMGPVLVALHSHPRDPIRKEVIRREVLLVLLGFPGGLFVVMLASALMGG